MYGDYNDWERGRGATVSYGTGPRYDHTYGNNTGIWNFGGNRVKLLTIFSVTGHYMYVEASNANTGYNSHGKLISRKVKAVTQPRQCFLTLWYHMIGTAVGNLDIYKRPDNTYIWQQIFLFNNHGSLKDRWYNVTIDLYRTDFVNNNFEISIEASNFQSNQPSSDIAVDDISFSLGCSFVGKCLHMIP